MIFSFFVDPSAPDIKKYFSKHVPGWLGKGLDEIVSIATFVFNGRDERLLKQKRKEQEQKACLLVAALNSNPRLRGQGCRGFRGKGRGRNFRSSGPWGRGDCCNYCGQQGHWKLECPV